MAGEVGRLKDYSDPKEKERQRASGQTSRVGGRGVVQERWAPVHIHRDPETGELRRYQGLSDNRRHRQEVRAQAAAEYRSAHAILTGPGAAMGGAAIGVGATGYGLVEPRGVWANESGFLRTGRFAEPPGAVRGVATSARGNPARISARFALQAIFEQRVRSMIFKYLGSPHPIFKVGAVLAQLYQGNQRGIYHHIPPGYGWFLERDCGKPDMGQLWVSSTNFDNKTNCLNGQTGIGWYQPGAPNTTVTPDGRIYTWDGARTMVYGLGRPSNTFNNNIWYCRPSQGGGHDAPQPNSSDPPTTIPVVEAPRPWPALKPPQWVEVPTVDPWAPVAVPELIGIGQPAPSTVPVPYRLQPHRRLNPNRDPKEQPDMAPPYPVTVQPQPLPTRPVDRPADRPNDWATSVVVGGAPGRVQPRAPAVHRSRPPRKNETERKFVSRMPTAIRWAAENITEGADMAQQFWEALPEQYRTGYKKNRDGKWVRVYGASFPQKIRDLTQHMNKIAVDKALAGIVQNYGEDALIGGLAQAGQKQASPLLRRLNRPAGFTTGPAL